MTTSFLRTLAVKIVSSSNAQLCSCATLTVSLEDVSLADASAVTMALTRVVCTGPFPLTLQLNYDTRSFEAGHTYALSARVEFAGKLLYITTSHHNFDPAQLAETATITVDPVACSVSEGVHGGNRPEGIHGGNLSEGIHGGNRPEGIHGGNLSEGIHGGNLPEGIHGGNLSEGIHGGNLPEGIHGGNLSEGIHGGNRMD